VRDGISVDNHAAVFLRYESDRSDGGWIFTGAGTKWIPIPRHQEAKLPFIVDGSDGANVNQNGLP
jgi:hypothetical protein